MRYAFYFILLLLLFSCKDKAPDKSLRNSVFTLENSITTDDRLSRLENEHIKSESEQKNNSTYYDSNSENNIYLGDFTKIKGIKLGSGKFSYFKTDNSIVKSGDDIFILDLNLDIWKYDTITQKKVKFFTNPSNKTSNYGNLTTYNDNILYSLDSGHLYLVNRNGEVLWHKFDKSFQFVSGFLISDDMAFGINSYGDIFAIMLKTGEQKWTYKSDSGQINIFSSKNKDSFLNQGKPFIVNSIYSFSQKLIAFSNHSGDITFLNKETGEYIMKNTANIESATSAIGKTSMSLKSVMFSPIVINDGTIILSGSINEGINIVNTKDLNSSFLPMNTISPIIYSENFAYFISNNNSLIAMHLQSGAVKWSLQLEEFFDHKLPKYLSEGRGYIRMKLNFRGPMFLNNSVLLTSPFGKMILVNIETGEIEKEVKIPQCVFSAPVINKSVYFYSMCDEKLYHFDDV